jgi:hypothetical protein
MRLACVIQNSLSDWESCRDGPPDRYEVVSSRAQAMFKRMGMTLKDLCVLSPALTGDYESSIALLHDDAECAKILADLEKSKRDMTRTSYEVNPNRSPDVQPSHERSPAQELRHV